MWREDLFIYFVCMCVCIFNLNASKTLQKAYNKTHKLHCKRTNRKVLCTEKNIYITQYLKNKLNNKKITGTFLSQASRRC